MTNILKKKIKENPPQDLGLVVVSNDIAMWKEVVEGYETEIKTLEKRLIVNKKFLETAKTALADAEKADDE